MMSHLSEHIIDWMYLEEFKNLSHFDLFQVSHFLSISNRTLKSYPKGSLAFGRSAQEHLLFVLSPICTDMPFLVSFQNLTGGGSGKLNL